MQCIWSGKAKNQKCVCSFSTPCNLYKLDRVSNRQHQVTPSGHRENTQHWTNTATYHHIRYWNFWRLVRGSVDYSNFFCRFVLSALGRKLNSFTTSTSRDLKSCNRSLEFLVWWFCVGAGRYFEKNSRCVWFFSAGSMLWRRCDEAFTTFISSVRQKANMEYLRIVNV